MSTSRPQIRAHHYISGWCPAAAHRRCAGGYAGTACCCPCHTPPSAAGASDAAARKTSGTDGGGTLPGMPPGALPNGAARRGPRPHRSRSGAPVSGELAEMFDRELAQIRGLLLRGETYPARRPTRQPNTTHALAGYSAPADALGIARPPDSRLPLRPAAGAVRATQPRPLEGARATALAAASSPVRVALRVVSSLSSPGDRPGRPHLHTCQVPRPDAGPLLIYAKFWCKDEENVVNAAPA